MTFVKVNHYVPIWYQQRFIPQNHSERKYFCLDLHPEILQSPGGTSYVRQDLRFLGPRSCFCQEHLYTQFFGETASDVVEKHFYGKIDRDAQKAFATFPDIAHDFQNLIHAFFGFLGSQIFRTPKGLDYLKLVTNNAPRDQILALLPRFTNTYLATWLEGIWEVVSCTDSPTKFIVSDHPVTLYNRKVFPSNCPYPLDPSIGSIGTQTILPLDLDHCLVITHLQFVRNPRINQLKTRENFRVDAPAMFHIRNIQEGRELDEKSVIAINFILKKRAKRYIAAAEKDWLYPEKRLKRQLWNHLGDEFFLMPDPRKTSFTTSIGWGDKKGMGYRIDEYGRETGLDTPLIVKQRAEEYRTFHNWQERWDGRFGPLTLEELKDSLGIPR